MTPKNLAALATLTNSSALQPSQPTGSALPSDLSRAAADLNDLLVSTSATGTPAQLFTLYTKCDVGLLPPSSCTRTSAGNLLTDACKSIATDGLPHRMNRGNVGAIKPNFQWSASTAIMQSAIAGFERSVQRHDASAGLPEHGDPVPPQSFDSVLYNLQAACTIRNLGSDPQSIYNSLASAAQNAAKNKDLTVLDGAKVVKLIWEPAPDLNEGITDAATPVVQTGNLTKLLPNDQLNSDGTLLNIARWPGHSYQVQIDMNSKDAQCTQPPTGIVYPKSCFVTVDLNQDGVKKADIVKKIGSALILSNPGGQKNNLRYLVLVGINMMELDRKSNYSNWLWSSFWWATQPPSRTLLTPPQWSHFSGCAISAPRSGKVDDPDPANLDNPDNLCFNPYLEGGQSPNGAYSNCMNCHSQATFQVKQQAAVAGSAFSQHTQFLTCLNSPDHSGNVPENCPRQDSISIENPTFPTHFLWSVADLLQPSEQAQVRKLSKDNK